MLPVCFISRNRRAFTLLEVMIAFGIFSVAVFAILNLTSRNLEAARLLQTDRPEVDRIAASLAQTNELPVGGTSGDFGEAFPGYAWESSIVEVRSNGLFQVDITVYSARSGDSWSKEASLLLYRPEASESLGSALRAQ